MSSRLWSERIAALVAVVSRMESAPIAKRSSTVVSEVVVCRVKAEVFSRIVSAPFKVKLVALTLAAPATDAASSPAVASSSCVDTRIDPVAETSVSVVEATSLVAVKDAVSATATVNAGVFTAVDVVAVRVELAELRANASAVRPRLPEDVRA